MKNRRNPKKKKVEIDRVALPISQIEGTAKQFCLQRYELVSAVICFCFAFKKTKSTPYKHVSSNNTIIHTSFIKVQHHL